MAGRAGAKKKDKVGVCIMCRNTFQCARLDKKTCSAGCRKAWQRYNEHEEYLKYKAAIELPQEQRLIALINNKFSPIYKGK